MDLNAAQTLATDLMTEHGLIALGWRFVFDERAQRRVGQTRYAKKEIGLSLSALPHNSEALIRDVILHEIAHAHVGPGAGHGPVWRRMAASIGAKPRSTTAAMASPDAFRYEAHCNADGGHVCGKRMRRPKAGLRHQCTRHMAPVFWLDTRTNRFLDAAPAPTRVAAAKAANPWDGGTDWDAMFNA
jgi:predicted SprT family Zn-dependent metalloprotease